MVCLELDITFWFRPCLQEEKGVWYPENLEYYLFGMNSDWHLSHSLSKAPNFEQELDISLSGNLSDKKESEIIKISIPSEKEKSRQHIIHDPLTQNDYNIETENIV